MSEVVSATYSAFACELQIIDLVHALSCTADRPGCVEKKEKIRNRSAPAARAPETPTDRHRPNSSLARNPPSPFSSKLLISLSKAVWSVAHHFSAQEGAVDARVAFPTRPS
jgi:hypothetical protein